MRVVINEEKARDFVRGSEGKIRTPMYFSRLSTDAQEIFKSILETGYSYTYEISEGIPTFAKALAELAENGYISFFW